MRSSGYGSYRGKSRFHTFLKVLIIILMILLIIGVAAFFFLEKYLVYSSDGLRLELPFRHTPVETGAPVSSPVNSDELVLATPEVTPEPEAQPLHGVLLPSAALYDGSAERLVADAGGNAAIFDMKADDGSLGYISALDLSVSAKTSASDPALNAAIRGLNGGELYTVARISCFRDNTVPRARMDLAVRSNSGNWRDSGDHRWLSPASEEARQYVIGICLELAELGFDEILLDNSAYPVNGKLSYIKAGAGYEKANLGTVVDGFYSEVRQALADYPQVKLSIVGTESSITDGADADGGQNAASLVLYADHIWLPKPQRAETDYQQAMEVVGDGTGADKIVQIQEEVGAAQENWAVLTSANA